MLRDIDGNSCELVERQLDIGIAGELRLFGRGDWERYSGHSDDFQSGMSREVGISWKAMEKKHVKRGLSAADSTGMRPV